MTEAYRVFLPFETSFIFAMCRLLNLRGERGKAWVLFFEMLFQFRPRVLESGLLRATLSSITRR